MPTKDVLFSFEGRITRSEFWLKGMVIPILLPLFLALALAGRGALMAVGIALCIVLAWPWLALYVKRLHDRNHSAWYLLPLVIPGIGQIWGLVIVIQSWFLRGTFGANDYGHDRVLESAATV